MPLFGRRLYRLNQDDIKDNNEQFYTIEHTEEIFHSQILYDKIKKIYDLERWTCECTWRAGLTHQEAYTSEIEIRKSLSTIIPNYFHKPIFDIVYHNVKPLEKLAEEVSIILGQSFVINEPVQFKKRKDTTIVKGMVERIEDNDDPKKRTSERASVQAKLPSDKQMKNVKYSIRLLDEDEVIHNVLPSELQRCSLIPNREKLKTFIRAYTIRLGNRADSPWIFYDNLNIEKYELKDRISSDIIEKFKKSSTITLDEIIREQERIARKQAEEQAAALEDKKKSDEINNNTSIPNGHSDDFVIVLSDDNQPTKSSNEIKKKKVKSSPSIPKQQQQQEPSPSQSSSSLLTLSNKKSQPPSKAKKQLTLHDMKFTKNSPNHKDLLEKSSTTTYDISIPYSLLQKLDKTRRDRGIDSKFFQRLILQCARTLNDKQRLRLPDEYRSLIQIKYEELELKRRLAQMTDEEKKLFLQTKRLEEKPIEDLDLTFSKDLPIPKQIESTLSLSSNSIGNLMMISTFLTSCHSLFYLSLNDDIPKTTQLYLRSFKLDYLLNTSTTIFSNYFIEILQIFMKLLFKEDENRSNNNDDDDDDDEDDNENNNNNNDDKKNENNEEKNSKNNHKKNTNEPIDIDKDIEQIYSIQLSDIPLTPFTCQELTRLYLSKEKDENNQIILDKLANCETKDLTISEQIDLLLLLVNTITTDNELMSDYFEYLTRTLSEASRERNQLLAERRKAQEEESKQKKLQLQNGENEKISTKKGPLITPKNSHGTTNDENRQTSPIIVDENGDIDNGNDDDLKTVLQRRRQMVAMSKELKEKREIEAQKLQIKQKRQLALQKAEQVYQDALLNLQHGFRIKPLGFDRHYNRYWFFRGHPGLFVEKGWIGSDINYSAQSLSQDIVLPSLSNHHEKSIPKDELNQWFIYDDENHIQQLFQSLNDRGIREHNLSINLKKMMPFLHNEFEQIKKTKNSLEQQDENSEQTNDIINSFKIELEDIETRLRLGSLGGFINNENLLDWQIKLKQSNQRLELAELLLQLQQTIADKYASGIFNQSDKKSLQIWINDCRTCKTYSRLYVLMMIFENSITWNKSTLGMKCKVCRKKHKDEFIIVCDQCCYGYHRECLRYSKEYIKNSHNDLWFCPACRPPIKRREKFNKKKINYNDDDDEMEIENNSNNLSYDDNLCCICGVDNDLIRCNQCHLYYHCQCHEPPLRCPPRSTTWICNNCRNGISNETKIRKEMKKNQKQINTRRSGTQKNYYEEEEEEEEAAEESEEEEEEESTTKRRSKRLRRSDPSPVKNLERTRQRNRLVKSISSSSSSSSTNETDDNNDQESDMEENDDENENTSNDSPSSD